MDSEILTWPALVPYNEVLAGSRAWICTKQPVIDEKLAAPPVLALVQHLLQPGMHTRNRETKALQYLHQGDRQTETSWRTAKAIVASSTGAGTRQAMGLNAVGTAGAVD